MGQEAPRNLITRKYRLEDTEKEKLLSTKLHVIIYHELRGRSNDTGEMVETFEQVVSVVLSDRRINFKIQKIDDHEQMLDTVMELVQNQQDPCVLLLYFPNQTQEREGYIWDTLSTIHDIEASYPDTQVPVLIATYNDDQEFSRRLGQRLVAVPDSLPKNLLNERGQQLFVVDPLTEVTPNLMLPRLQKLLPKQSKLLGPGN